MNIVRSTAAYEQWLRKQLNGDVVEKDLDEKHARMAADAFQFPRDGQSEESHRGRPRRAQTGVAPGGRYEGNRQYSRGAGGIGRRRSGQRRVKGARVGQARPGSINGSDAQQGA